MTARSVAKRGYSPRWLLAALTAVSLSAVAAAPKEALITREAQDLYRAGVGQFYLRTLNCHEQIFGDRVVFRWTPGGRGGVMFFRGNDRSCIIQKVLREVDPDTMQPIQMDF